MQIGENSKKGGRKVDIIRTERFIVLKIKKKKKRKIRNVDELKQY